MNGLTPPPAESLSRIWRHTFGDDVARLKMPKQPGHWPAFWLMCGGVGSVGDEGRDGTEIDIVEIPWRAGRITMNLHWDGDIRKAELPDFCEVDYVRVCETSK